MTILIGVFGGAAAILGFFPAGEEAAEGVAAGAAAGSKEASDVGGNIAMGLGFLSSAAVVSNAIVGQMAMASPEFVLSISSKTEKALMLTNLVVLARRQVLGPTSYKPELMKHRRL